MYHTLLYFCGISLIPGRLISLQWWSEPNSFHVCITSYKLLLKDQAHFLKRRWRHLVLDEVQLIKNMTEKHWETIFTLRRSEAISSCFLSLSGADMCVLCIS